MILPLFGKIKKPSGFSDGFFCWILFLIVEDESSKRLVAITPRSGNTI